MRRKQGRITIEHEACLERRRYEAGFILFTNEMRRKMEELLRNEKARDALVDSMTAARDALVNNIATTRDARGGGPPAQAALERVGRAYAILGQGTDIQSVADILGNALLHAEALGEDRHRYEIGIKRALEVLGA